MELEKRERGLAGGHEGRVRGGEDGERMRVWKQGIGDELESQRHGEIACICEDLGGIKNRLGRERGGERVDKERYEERESEEE